MGSLDGLCSGLIGNLKHFFCKFPERLDTICFQRLPGRNFSTQLQILSILSFRSSKDHVFCHDLYVQLYVIYPQS